MDGEKWHFAGDNYKAADSGKYFNVDVIETAKDSMNNCIIFRPNDISEYLGSYNISISGLANTNTSALTAAPKKNAVFTALRIPSRIRFVFPAP